MFGDMEWTTAAGLAESAVAYVGLRSLDERERELLREGDVTAFTMSDIDQRGVSAVVEDALAVATDGTDGVHVSLDLDWLDPKTAPGVGTPVRGGVTYREAHAALETLSRRDEAEGILRSMDVVEVNPILDEANETATLAAELTASAFGKRIL
jgi:arginase